MFTIQKAVQLFSDIGVSRNATISTFSDMVEKRIGRSIIRTGVALPLSIGGVCISVGDASTGNEIVLFNVNLPPLFQHHAQLHELGHIVLGHNTGRISDEDLWLSQLSAAVRYRSLVQLDALRLDKNQDEENEAELFATWASMYVLPDTNRDSARLLAFLDSLGIS